MTKTISVAFIKKDQTKTGKDKWGVKDAQGNWYTCWNESVASQLEDAQSGNYEVAITAEAAKDPKYNPNITAVTPPGVTKENFEGDILDVFREKTPAPKPVASELSMIVEERKAAIHMATLAFAAGKVDKAGITAYADYVLGYIQGSPIPNTKVVQTSNLKEETDDLIPERFAE